MRCPLLLTFSGEVRWIPRKGLGLLSRLFTGKTTAKPIDALQSAVESWLPVAGRDVGLSFQQLGGPVLVVGGGRAGARSPTRMSGAGQTELT